MCVGTTQSNIFVANWSLCRVCLCSRDVLSLFAGCNAYSRGSLSHPPFIPFLLLLPSSAETASIAYVHDRRRVLRFALVRMRRLVVRRRAAATALGADGALRSARGAWLLRTAFAWWTHWYAFCCFSFRGLVLCVCLMGWEMTQIDRLTDRHGCKQQQQSEPKQ